MMQHPFRSSSYFLKLENHLYVQLCRPQFIYLQSGEKDGKMHIKSGLDVCPSSTTNVHQNTGLLLHAPLSCVALAMSLSSFRP